MQGKDVVASQLFSAVRQDTSKGIIGTPPKHGQASYMKAERGRRCEEPGWGALGFIQLLMATATYTIIRPLAYAYSQ